MRAFGSVKEGKLITVSGGFNFDTNQTNSVLHES